MVEVVGVGSYGPRGLVLAGLLGVVSGGLDSDDISDGVDLEGLEGVAIFGCELGLAYGVLVVCLLSTLCIIFNFQH